MADCNCDKSEPRDIIELNTPLYQACGGRLYRLHIMTAASAILMGDGMDVETRVNSLERALLANTTTYFADTIAQRDMVGPLTAGDRCYVFDATADATVPYGSAMYIWLPSRKWKKLYNGESPLEVENLYVPGGGLTHQGEKLTVKISDLYTPNKGLAQDASGKLIVNLSQMSAAELEAMVKEMMKAGSGVASPGGGVAVSPDGKIVIVGSEIISSGGGLTTDENGKLKVKAADLVEAGGGLQATAAGKLKVKAADIISASGGLAADASGKLKVDFAQMPASTLKPMVLAMIQTGGGLSVDDDGHIFLDADSMGDTVYNKIRSRFRLTNWLGSNLVLNVNKTTGVDTVVDGVHDDTKPFKSLQACLDYALTNFNLNKYNLTINVAAGDYYTGTRAEKITIGAFQATTGRLIIKGAG